MINNYLNVARKLIPLLAFTLFFGLNAQAQQSVSGKITDASDASGIPGVNVVEKGTTNGTITDFDGNYTISIGSGATLVFSYVGYTSQEVVVGSQSVIDIGLELDVQSLAEVIVIGYGTQEKKDATGATASIKSEDFNKGVIASPEQLLNGKLPGVQLTSNSGEPGGGINIRIRGTSSVRSNNNPLFVVDGVPLSGGDVSAGGDVNDLGSSDSRNPLNFLNPNDIASIDVLKDASATAIYGSRGANGVVIITTKTGTGKGTLTYSGALGVANITREYDLMGAQQYLAGYETFNGAGSSSAIDGGTETDWQDVIFRTAVTQTHNISFGGGDEGGSYRVSTSYDELPGIVENSYLERFTVRVNASQKFIDDKLNVSTALTYSDLGDEAAAIANSTGFEGDLLGNALKANPSQPVYLADGVTWRQVSDSEPNPQAMLDLVRDETRTVRALGNIAAEYEIIEGFSFKTVFGYDRSFSDRTQALSSDLNAFQGLFGNGRMEVADIEQDNILWENYFTYVTTFGSTKFTGLLGYSYQDFKNSTQRYRFHGFRTPNLDLMINNYASAELRPSVLNPTGGNRAGVVARNSSFEEDELQSFFARVNFDIDSKYILTATVRADGSTKFGSGNQYGVFPSLAGKWRISEEDFAPGGFDDLALRVGWGITGNQEIPHNRFTPRNRYNDYSLDATGNVTGGDLSSVAFANPDLQWEQTSQLNIGIDFGIINNRLTGTLDFYSKKTKDLLFQTFSAQPAAQEFVWENLDAEVRNQGFEIGLNYSAVDGADFSWDISGQLSYNDNEITDFAGRVVNTGIARGQGLSNSFTQRLQEGQPLFAWYLREFEGYDANGISIYKDGDVQRFLDKGSLPTTTWGLTNSFTYKAFDLSFLLQGSHGNYVYNNTANALFTAGALANARNTTPGVPTSGESRANAPDVSTRFLEPGWFVRLSNLSIGWNAVTGGGVISLLRLAITGQNVFLIDDYSGQDPEVNTDQSINDIPSFGIDYTPYPKARIWTLGVTASF